MQIAILRFPGTNNEDETKKALDSFNISTEILEYYQYEKINKFDGIWIAGGFSFGDIIRAGAIASATEVIKLFKKSQKPIIGICNGFQILTESHFLDAVLLPNTSTRFICKWIYMKIPSNNSYLSELEDQVLKLPIAHFEGNLWFEATNSEVIGYYCNKDGTICRLANPNGSKNNIAGLHSPKKQIVGLMPHPERASFKYQGSVDGRKIIHAFIQEVKR